MLRISKLADYATLILSHLAKQTDQFISATVLAKECRLSSHVVSKILKMLTHAHLTVAVRGAEGGYRLARAAQDITLAEVITAMEGGVCVTECCSKDSACVLNGSCGMKNNWNVINQVIHSTLSKVTVKDMMVPLHV